MNLQQLVQMAPFMSKEAVEEIVMAMQENMSAGQLVKIAPYVRPECLEALLEKHAPELDWDVLRRLAPFMSRDAVDALARKIASGETTVKTPEDAFNKTMNDIGKAFDDLGRGVEKTIGDIGKGVEKTFDDIGKGVDKAFRKAVKLGECVVNEVSRAFSVEEAADPAEARSLRLLGIRKKAFERALADEKWDWIGLHIAEIRNDTETLAKIACAARERGRHDFIRAHMSEYADMQTIDEAISQQDWEWLGENVWQYDGNVQEKIAQAAAAAGNWQWLYDFSDPMELVECGMDIARQAMAAGENRLLGSFAERHLIESQCDALAAEAYAAEKSGALNVLLDKCSVAFREHILTELAEKGAWEQVRVNVKRSDGEIIEKLMETAVEQGNFDAIDLLDALL